MMTLIMVVFLGPMQMTAVTLIVRPTYLSMVTLVVLLRAMPNSLSVSVLVMMLVVVRRIYQTYQRAH
jgi:hypothetical protein